MSRYTLDLGEKLDRLLEELSKAHTTTKSDVIRRAVASYAYLDAERNAGRKLVVTDEHSNTVKEIVLP